MSETTTSAPRKKSSSVNNGNGKVPGGDDPAAARSRRLLMAMVAFRDGDFSVRLPTDWPGLDGRIAEAFNQSLAHEGRISREVARLSETVGKEGRLKQRMTLPGAIGEWAEKVDSINTLLDDLVRPTTEVARTMGRVPSFRQACEHDDRAALRVHLGSNARCPRGRDRGQARRPGEGPGRVGRVEGTDRVGQPDGR
jgi:hypothetical protein